MEYEWGQLTTACPQQFIIAFDNNVVAYLRIRGGHLSVHPAKDNEDCTDYDIDFDTVIYEKEYDDQWLGKIPEEDIGTVTSEVKKALTEHINNKKQTELSNGTN